MLPNAARAVLFAIGFGLSMKLAQIAVLRRFGINVSNGHLALVTCLVTIFIVWFGFIASVGLSVLIGLGLLGGFWALQVSRRS